eukprot:2096413-Lingulodinium_polyedra.AAC.1
MVGIGTDRKLRTKAMETYFLLCFLVSFLPSVVGSMGDAGVRCLDAGKVLVQLVDRFKAAPPVITFAVCGELLDMWKRFMLLVEPMEMYTPKAHLMFHLVTRSLLHGNPVHYQTFADEGLNRVLKRSLRLCHQSNFELMGLIKFGAALEKTGRQRVA